MTTTPATERSKSPSSVIEIDQEAYAKLSPAHKEEFDALLAELEGAIKRNPLEAYRPYPKQQAFHAAKERTKAFIGGSRTGKTTCSCADDLIQALPLALVPEHLRPYKRAGFDRPFKGRVITPDLGHTMMVVLDKYQAFVPEQALRAGKWDKAFDKVHRILHFANGAQIDFMSTEQHPNKFGGVDLDRIHFDEEPAGPNSWAIYRDCDTRLLDRDGDMVLSMTPLMETDWVEAEIWDKRHDPNNFAIRASMLDNPYLDPTRVAQLLEKLTKEERRAIEHGEFVSFAGKFFDEFSDLHRISAPSREEIQAADDIVVAIDPGKQTAVLWIAFDRDNNATAFAELYPFDKTVDQIVPEIEEMNREWGIDDPIYVIDPNAVAKTGPARESYESAYIREGIVPRMGQNARGPTIMEIKRRLQSSPPSAYVSEDCPNLLWEIPRYRRDPGAQDEWMAVKKNDHAIDAWRYGLAERTWFIPDDPKSPRETRSPFEYQPPYEAHAPTPPLGSFS